MQLSHIPDSRIILFCHFVRHTLLQTHRQPYPAVSSDICEQRLLYCHNKAQHKPKPALWHYQYPCREDIWASLTYFDPFGFNFFNRLCFAVLPLLPLQQISNNRFFFQPGTALNCLWQKNKVKVPFSGTWMTVSATKAFEFRLLVLFHICGLMGRQNTIMGKKKRWQHLLGVVTMTDILYQW